MTPALLTALSDVHRRVHDPKAQRRTDTAEQGSAADLMMLATMRTA